jgi:acetylornithine/N-succinyldiaminopimelate aminotransferase
MLAHFASRNLEASWSEGTFYLWLAVPAGFTSESYAARLLEKGIVVSPGTMFGAGEGFVRVALVPSVEEIDQAIAQWP